MIGQGLIAFHQRDSERLKTVLQETTLKVIRGNHLSKITRLTQTFFKSGEQCCKYW